MSALHSACGPDLTADTLYRLLRLRVEVFMLEQDCLYQELDGRDRLPDTVHLWWQPDDEPLAYLRVLGAPGGERRVGRVCVARQARGTGLGGRLMAAALAHIGSDESVLDAQVHVRDMYTRFGYLPEGEVFDDHGVDHIRMRRPATP
ncbi:GNAT family N-acetyltransferase [Actinokineospora iranica]|uniref:ElaA protein n=1 Tax=Actinokineospora iranica TaxID=1271860 RepID=A0A1G6NFJ9_9PSEU|nr:GNAT family N-acetyltransferase [Actinokineospora iranica]SDC66649.1 ElaA protein [Actinokineospora iranica]